MSKKKLRKPESRTVRLAKLGGEETEERILMRRKWLQVIVHSCIYYRLNYNIIGDKTWDIWAREVVALRDKYPGIAKRMPYAEDLMKFDGTTGFDLPFHEPQILSVAQSLMDYDKKLKESQRNGKLLRKTTRRNKEEKPRQKCNGISKGKHNK